MERRSQMSVSSSMGAVGGAGSQWLTQLFNKLDTNGDGSISTDELGQSKLATDFGASVNDVITLMDSNQDGGISQSELDSGLKNLQQQMQSEMLKKLDTNGDGVLSQDELAAGLSAGASGSATGDVSKLFSALDTNGDGSVSESELASGMQKAHGHHHHHGGGQQTQGATARSAGGSGSLSSLLDAIDAASGSPSSGSPSSGSGSTTFDVKDTNQDGVVSTAEELAYDLKNGTGSLSANGVSNVVTKALEQYAQAGGVTATAANSIPAPGTSVFA